MSSLIFISELSLYFAQLIWNRFHVALVVIKKTRKKKQKLSAFWTRPVLEQKMSLTQ